MCRHDVALTYVCVATETATIRVSRETRDRLAVQARRRGISLASMLAEYAQQAERDAAFAAERDATRRDAGDDATNAEAREWEATLADGVD
jgi:hypothetical protein